MFTIEFKDGKQMFPSGIKAPVLHILDHMEVWALRYHVSKVVITAGEEPGHPGGDGGPSYHDEGLAVDNRVHDWEPSLITAFFDYMRSRLGDFYDVVYEGAGTPNAHGHIEFDRRRFEASGGAL